MPPVDHSTHDQLERSLAEVDWVALSAGRDYYPSPANWQDELLYFLLLDRFSDGREHDGFGDDAGAAVGPGPGRSTPIFAFPQDAYTADLATWFEAGKGWCGGTLAGLRDKLGYLKRLGVTAIWLSPVFKQCAWDERSYHGYGIQNFLDVDPRFGTREELRALVDAAHAVGIRVVLDIIFNHSGDVFAYADGEPGWGDRVHPVAGFRDAAAAPDLPFGPLGDEAWPDGALWPRELQAPEAFTREGRIRNWDHDPEYLRGDFFSLKNLEHGSSPRSGDLDARIAGFRPGAHLWFLCQVYRYWIAFADVDGFRIDTVKHMEPGAVRFFCNAIKEFAQSLGKESFYLIGEITGGRGHAVAIMDRTGLDAALGINEIPDKLEFLAKGLRDPDGDGYFDLFRNSVLDGRGSHRWYGEHVITMFDDHDQIGPRHKFRFAGDKVNQGWRYLVPATALNLLSAGIPCLYYGSEQAFDGHDHRAPHGDDGHSDVVLRECMFGGPFGSLRSTGRHFFDEQHPVYRQIAAIAVLRRRELALRRGRQYLRPISADGRPGSFAIPRRVGGQLRWVVAWSRIFTERELLCAISTDAERALTVWIQIDALLNPPGTTLRVLHSSDPAAIGATATVEARDGAAIQVTVPAAGCVVLGR